MTVLSVAYPLFPVGSWSSGGAEQILYLLDRGFVQTGVRSVVIAARGSSISGELLETNSGDTQQTDEMRERARAEHRIVLRQALQRERIDIVHYHGLDFNHYRAEDSPAPQVATLHLPTAWYPPEVFLPSPLKLVCVSQSHAASAPEGSYVSVVQNGISVDDFTSSVTKSNTLLWLGRVCPEKGTHLALQVAHQTNLPLIVAGPVHPFESHQKYFAEEVRPLLDDKRRYIGPVDFETKAELLTSAKCVLVPSLAPETSSLVAMEAASSGTPVVAFRSGALPELIEHGLTGFIVDSEAEMAQAVLRSHEISPAQCRKRAESRFSARRMVADYLELYRSLGLRARPLEDHSDFRQ